jgi:hypothetical protein
MGDGGKSFHESQRNVATRKMKGITSPPHPSFGNSGSPFGQLLADGLELLKETGEAN